MDTFPGDDAADRWDELLTAAEKDLQTEIDHYFSAVTNASAKELTGNEFTFSTEALSELAGATDQAKIDFMLANLDQVKALIAQRMKDVYDASVAGAYANAIAETDKDFGGVGHFTDNDLEIFKQTKTNDSIWFRLESQAAAIKVHDALVRYAITGSALSLKAFELPEVMDKTKLSKYGGTIIRTSVSSFYRQAKFLRGANAGVKKYKYGGPKPLRPFCDSHWGKIYPVTEIVNMSNGQTRAGSVMLTMGGYNCRHRWIPILSNSDE
jgi:hypothetical protein